MVLGWTLRKMTDHQLQLTWDLMGNGGKKNAHILTAIVETLEDEEDFVAFIDAQFGDSTKSCLLGLSDRCLYVVEKKRRKNFRIRELGFDRIIFAGFKRTAWYGRLDVWEHGVETHYDGHDKSAMEQFSKGVIDRVDAWRKTHDLAALTRPVQEVKEVAGAPGLIDELERLSVLKRDGHITDAEFAIAKESLLKRRR